MSGQQRSGMSSSGPGHRSPVPGCELTQQFRANMAAVIGMLGDCAAGQNHRIRNHHLVINWRGVICMDCPKGPVAEL